MNYTRKPNFHSNKLDYFFHHTSSEYTLRGEIWLEKNGRIFIDSKRVTLLILINEYGSLAAAARSMKLGYNTAWLWIMAMNRLSPSPLVERGAGGANGGYSVLTTQGQKIIDEYKKLNSSLKETINESHNIEPVIESKILVSV